MASRRITIHDLTEDSSSDENTTLAKTSITPQLPPREPLEAIQNSAKPTSKVLSQALRSAISTLSEARLRKEFAILLSQHDAARADLERKLLVKGKAVSRYCGDPEDHEEVETEDEEGEIRTVQRRGIRYPKFHLPISIGDDEWTPRFSSCENCGEEFDVSNNSGRDCNWHTGVKDLDFDADCWADHDENCHGPFEDWDDYEHREGFVWDCCDAFGDNKGCMSTNHKTDINVPITDDASLATTRKRKAEEPLARPATCVKIC